MCAQIRYHRELIGSGPESLSAASCGNALMQAVGAFLSQGGDRYAKMQLSLARQSEDATLAWSLFDSDVSLLSQESALFDLLLSREDGWIRTDDGMSSPDRAFPSPGTSCWTTSLARRIQFLDLPFRFPALHSSLPSPQPIATGKGVPPQSSAGRPDSGSVAVGVGDRRPSAMTYRGKRRIPPLGLPVVEDTLVSPVCLPFVMALRGENAIRRDFQNFILRLAPMELRLTFRAPDAEGLLQDRATSTYLRQWVGRLFEPGSSMVFPHSREAWSCYGQYWSAPEDLLDVAISVVATSRDRMLALAHLFSSAFLAPGCLGSDPDGVTQGEHGGECGVSEKWFDGRGLLYDQVYQGFMSRMRQRFTVQEALVLSNNLAGALGRFGSLKEAAVSGV